jgi:hypothetical protein
MTDVSFQQQDVLLDGLPEVERLKLRGGCSKFPAQAADLDLPMLCK